MSAFLSTVSAPPGGEWFWEDDEAFIHSPSYHDTLVELARYFRMKGIAKDPAAALAEHMCPRMPRGFCRGTVPSAGPTLAELLARTEEHCADKRMQDAGTVQRRLEVCAKCPKCTKPTCIPCRGVDMEVYRMFGGRRPPVPADRKSGVCSCFGVFTMALASVDDGAPNPPDLPDTCWRNNP